MPGLLNIRWDASSGILFTSQGAYESSYTAYLPDAPALRGWHGSARLRASRRTAPEPTRRLRPHRQHWTTLATAQTRSEGLDDDIWGLSGTFCGLEIDPEAKPIRYDLDWKILWGNKAPPTTTPLELSPHRWTARSSARSKGTAGATPGPATFTSSTSSTA